MKILSTRPWEMWEKDLISKATAKPVFLQPNGKPGQTMEELIAEADVLYGFPGFSMGAIVRSPNLKLVHVASTGVDTLLTPEFRDSKVALTNSKGVHAAPVAEHAVALMFSVAYGMRIAAKHQDACRWSPNPITRLYGKTAGLLGLGAIGLEIAKRCKALDMRVIGIKRTPSGDIPNVDQIMTGEDLPQLLSETDVLMCSLPLTPETRGFLSLKRMNMMKSSSIVVNVGRGAVIGESDLICALTEGIIAGAGLDVFETEPLPSGSPLWRMDNVVITPHTAGPAPENKRKSLDILVENLRRMEKGEPFINLVDKNLGY